MGPIRSWFKTHVVKHDAHVSTASTPHSPLPETTTSNDEDQDRHPASSLQGKIPIRSAARAGLGLIQEVSTVFAPLEGALRGLTFILDHHEQWNANKDSVRRLVERLGALQSNFRQGDEDEAGYSEKERERRRVFLRKLQDISDEIDAVRNKHSVSRYVAAIDDAETLSRLVEDIRDTLMDYQTLVQNDINERTEALMTSDDYRILGTLPRAPNASHLSENHKPCMRGTRTAILEELEAWADDPKSQPVFWLSGHAGSGKSTITQTFCKCAFADGRLGASFFCSRDYADRCDPCLIVPTLSFQLACRFPAFRTCIVAALKQAPDVGRESLPHQFSKLLVRPLEITGISTIIVIDALDECKETEPISSILSVLAQDVTNLPSIKFFISSRPEPPIRNALRIPSLEPRTRPLVLSDVEETSVDADIGLYLKRSLSETITNRSDVDVSSPWPSDEDIQTLTTRSAGLFVFAATAVSFITSPVDQPVERLALLTAVPEKNKGIDELYRTVLVCSGMGVMEPEYQDIWRLVVGSIVLISEPLSRNDLAELLRITPSKIASVLRPLHAVMKVTAGGDAPITVYHKSFRDYVTDPARCSESTFFIEPTSHHITLAQFCLQLVTTYLPTNVHDMFDESAVAGRHPAAKHLPGALGYACRFWGGHLMQHPSTSPGPELGALLRKFSGEKYHSWLALMRLFDDRAAILQSGMALWIFVDGMATDTQDAKDLRSKLIGAAIDMGVTTIGDVQIQHTSKGITISL